MNKRLTLLEAMERAEGKSTTLAFCNNILTHPSGTFVDYIKEEELKYTLRYVIDTGFQWVNSKEGYEFWARLSDKSNDSTLYPISFSMIEDYVKSAESKPAITNLIKKFIKEPNMAMIAPFNKGKLDIKGIVYQSAKGILDTRPFIKALIEEEFDRIVNQIKCTPTDEFNYSGYNIKIHHYRNQMLAMKRLLDMDSPMSASPLFMVDFYAYEKLLDKEDNYEWIASYLTQENMQKTEVTLFKSNKIHIFLRKGYIYLKDITKNILYETPVMYNRTTNTFYL